MDVHLKYNLKEQNKKKTDELKRRIKKAEKTNKCGGCSRNK